MTVVHIRPEDLPALLKSHEQKMPKAINDGLVLAAHRGRALLVKLSPVDQGPFKNSWQVRDLGAPHGAALFNDAPHAGIIEGGARPHFVNREGIDALTAWVLRKLTTRAGTLKGKKAEVYGPTFVKGPVFGPAKAPVYGPVKSQAPHAQAIAAAKRAANLQDAQKQARGIAFAIANKLSKEGQKGLFLVRDNLPTLGKYMQQEVSKQLNKALGGGK